MARYCLDTSGISNPLMAMPEDLYGSVWAKVTTIIEDGAFACTKEISDEYEHIEGEVGACICANKELFEVGQGEWDWQTYIDHVNRMRVQYKNYISEYNGNRKNTIGLNDLSIVALAKTIGLPVVSMEGSDRGQTSPNKMRIPRLCIEEGVQHYDFNDLLRNEGGL